MENYEYLDKNVRNQLLDLMDGEAEEIIDLIETLEETNPVYHQQLSNALTDNNPEGVRNASHSLKSVYAQIGALQMSTLMNKIEAAAKAGDIQTAHLLHRDVSQEESRVKQAFASWKTHLLS